MSERQPRVKHKSIIVEIIKNIKEFCSFVEEWNLTQHLVELKNYYFHPRIFWNKHRRLSASGKRSQFLTYFAIFALVILGFKGYTVENLFKLLTIAVSLTLVILVLIIGFLPYKSDNKFIVKEIAIYCCYYLFLIFPIVFIFWETYKITGSNSILFMHNVVYAVSDLYLWFAPVFIFIHMCKKRVIAILSVLMLLNIAEVIIYPMSGSGSSDCPNYVLEERYELVKSISNTYVIPHYVVTSQFDSEPFYLFACPVDTVAHNINTTKYFQEIDRDMDILSTIASECKYEENKIFFSCLYDIRRVIVYCHQHLNFSNKIIKETIVVDSTDKEIDKLTYRIFNEDILKWNNQLLTSEIEDIQAYKYAMMPRYIPMWIRPVLILVRKRDTPNNN